MAKLVDVKGIDESAAAKLKESGVGSAEKLLEVCGSKKGRKEIADATGLDEKDILNWVNRVDLSRVKGISGVYSDLLKLAGVDTVPELAQRNGANLHAKIVEFNNKENLASKMPTEDQVNDWVAQAKELPRVVTH